MPHIGTVLSQQSCFQ